MEPSPTMPCTLEPQTVQPCLSPPLTQRCCPLPLTRPLMLLLAAIALGPMPMLAAPALAQNCVANCRSDQMQFTPGDRLQVVVVNQTGVVVKVEQVPMIAPYTLAPQQSATMGFNWGTTPNISIRFWNPDREPLRAYLYKVSEQELRIELRPFPRQFSDRSIYIQNDGRVLIY